MKINKLIGYVPAEREQEENGKSAAEVGEEWLALTLNSK